MKYNPIISSDVSKDIRYYACDFETTTDKIAEDHTEVWSFAFDEIGTFEPQIMGSIDDFFNFIENPFYGIKKRLYFHNLKFDGEFILYEALRRGIKTAYVNGHMLKQKNLINNEMIYAISDVGQWYFITFMLNNITIEIRDSLKLLPMTLKQIGKSFCKKYQKSEMNYDNKRSLKDCSKEDIAYIKNDVLVLSEALDYILQLHGQKTEFGKIQSLTIGGACFQNFKNTNYGENSNICIKLEKAELSKSESGSDNMDEYIRNGYRGGYCYVNPKYKGKIIEQSGYTADVNSLYPFVMCSEYSGSAFPYGKGIYYKGKPEEKYIENESYYFYIRIKVAFVVRSGYVPPIQVKNSFMYAQNEYLTSSAIHDPKNEKPTGKPKEIEITLSKTDYILFIQHYKIISIQYLDYILFTTAKGICDEYIKEFEKIKINATENKNTGERTLAKLFSNNLYGQFAKSNNSSFKLAVMEDSEELNYTYIEEYEKKPVNIAIGASITAYARYYQIQTIQNNLKNFIYSDTDSIHAIGNPDSFKGKIHDTQYGAYKIESVWNRALFLRQKTYIEQLIVPENQKIYCENCKQHCNWNICCAGMTEQQKQFFREHHNFEDFETGLVIHGGKLIPKRVKGGIILKEVDFTLK